jgi:transposase
MNQEELEKLSKQEFIDMILHQHQQIIELMDAFKQLKADHEALIMKFNNKQKPPTSSKNSSQPPSKDQKSNEPKGKSRHRHGPPKGHARHEREPVAEPDKVIELRVTSCCKCHADLKAEDGQLVQVHQITELPEAKAQVIEVRQYQTTCSECGQVQVETAPPGLEKERTFGARLEATVVYYRQEQHMSYERTQLALLNLQGVEISQGGIDRIMQRVGNKAIQAAKLIEETVRQSKVIHSDETGCRVKGNNWWEWVFCTATAVLHVIRFNRSEDVIKEVMNGYKAEVWESDCYSAQLKAPYHQLQLCMAHQLRNLQAVVDTYPTQTWARAMQVMFRYAIHLNHQRDQLSTDDFKTQVARIERHCDRLLQRDLAPPEAKRLQRRYLKHRDKLFVFLYRSDVDPTNNVAERALRPSVIHRKVTGCFRSDWGAKAYAAIASVIDTAELSGIRAFDAIQSLFGSPSLPIPVLGE